MQSRIEREGLLELQAVETCGLDRVEDQVPTVCGNRARNRHEAMATETLVAKRLLPRARNSWPQPIGVRRVVPLDDVNLGYVKNLRRCEHEGHSVENLETFVDGDL
jgi:hypothetical protein